MFINKIEDVFLYKCAHIWYSACEPGTYGYECGEKCGQCEDQSKCFHTNGLCLTGCRNGYHGDLCKTLECK